MKKLYLLIFILFFFGSIHGQKNKNNYESKWFIGFNYGATWSCSDIANSWESRAPHLDSLRSTNPTGWSLFLGKSFNYEYGKILSFDLRGRYLRGHWYGQSTELDSFITAISADAQSIYDDYNSAYGGFIPNYYTKLDRLSLELVIHLNRLREKTGLDPYVFGGLGFSWKSIMADLTTLDENGNSLIYSEEQMLNNDLDFDFETNLIDKQKFFMPSLGFGLAYDFGNTSIGLEHKTTFTRGDQFDGYLSEVPRSDNDLYHYTSAFVRFRIGSSNYTRPQRPAPKPPSSVSDFSSCPTPIIDLINTNNTSSSQGTIVINAKLTNVNNVSEIELTDKNNMPLPFDYDANTNNLTATVSLVPGNNTFILKATTNCGSDIERLNIQNTTSSSSGFTGCPQPVVNILNANNVEVNQGVLSISAQILNLNSATEISFTDINQVPLLFNYNPNTNVFSATVTLNEGSNTFFISGTNNCGSDTERLNIQYTNCTQPTGVFISPVTNLNVESSIFLMQARILEISDPAMLRLFVNNSQVFGFNFNSTTGLLQSTLSLEPGQNIIQIDFANGCGQGTITNTIFYNQCETPFIELIHPSASGATTNNQSQNIDIQITGTDISKNNIKIKLNGELMEISAASFINQLLSFPVSLSLGTNNISVQVQNDCGSDSEEFTIDLENCNAPSIVFNGAQTGLITTQQSLGLNITINELLGSQNISYTLNGQGITGMAFNTQNNTLSGNITLAPGDNYFTISASNDCGTAIETLHLIYNDCKDPLVSITSPGSSNGATDVIVSNPIYTIMANLSNVNLANEISIKHNGNNINFSFDKGKVLSNVSLSPGLNNFNITVHTPCGETSQNLTIVYDDCEPPTITLKVPSSNATESNSQKVQVIAKLSNINDAGQITVLNNGLSIPFAFNNGIIKAQVILTDGTNTVVINAKNPCGEDTENISINYEPCLVPEISLNPSSIPSVIMTSSVPVTAVINNYAASTTITISVNGHSIANSYFQMTNGTLTANIPLANGINTISIYAVSPCGSDAETISILRCKNPSVNWINPALVNTVVTSESFTLQAMANNALEQSNIRLAFNGTEIPFSYNNNTELLSATVNLIPGNNVFAIRIQNTCGVANSNITVIYNPTIEAPQNPGNNGGNIENINNGKSINSNKGGNIPSNRNAASKNKSPKARNEKKENNNVNKSTTKQKQIEGQPKSNTSSGNKEKSKKEKEVPAPPKTPLKNTEKGKGR